MLTMSQPIVLYNCPECRWIHEPHVLTWPSINIRCRICDTKQYYYSLTFDGDKMGDLRALGLIEELKSNPNKQNKQISPIRSNMHREWIPIKTDYYKQILRNIVGLNTDVISTIVEMIVGN